MPVLFKGSKSQKVLIASFDPDKTYSCIREDLGVAIGMLFKLPNVKKMKTESGNPFLEAEQCMLMSFEIHNLNLSDEFMIVPHMTDEVIIGATTIRKWRFQLNFEKEKIIVDPRVADFILKQFELIQGEDVEKPTLLLHPLLF